MSIILVPIVKLSKAGQKLVTLFIDFWVIVELVHMVLNFGYM